MDGQPSKNKHSSDDDSRSWRSGHTINMINLVEAVPKDIIHVNMLRMTRVCHPVIAHEYNIYDIC